MGAGSAIKIARGDGAEPMARAVNWAVIAKPVRNSAVRVTEGRPFAGKMKVKGTPKEESQKMDERQLIRKARCGDAEAFGKLYETVYRELYQYALYTLRSAEDAEDAVSEAVTDAFAGIRSLRKEDSFRGWMRHILLQKCRRKMREYYRPEDSMEEREGLGEGSNESGMDPGLSLEYKMDDREEAMDVRESFFRLEARDRCILSMHLFFGYRTREIAEALEMNENSVRSRESRALKRLRKMLDPGLGSAQQ